MNPYTLRLITGPDEEPISLDEAKYHVQQWGEQDDDYITALITVARLAVEHEIGRPIGAQTFELGLPCWHQCIEFPRPPLTGIVSFKYTKQDGAVITLVDSETSPPTTSSLYTLELAAEPSVLILKSDEVWPADILALGYPIRIRYTAGLVTVPMNLKHAILLHVGHMYANREAVTEGTMVELPLAFRALCAPQRYVEYR